MNLFDKFMSIKLIICLQYAEHVILKVFYI